MWRKGAGLQAMSKPLFMHQPRHKDTEDPSVGARPEESTMRASPLQILHFDGYSNKKVYHNQGWRFGFNMS